MNLRFRTVMVLIAILPAWASIPVSAQEETPPLVLGGFQTQGSVTAGYRFVTVKGRVQKFQELFDLQKGFRVMDINLLGRAIEGANSFADSYSFTASGLGGDPFPGGQFTLRKNKLYDLRVSYRQSYYYWDRDDNDTHPTGLHALTSNHNWATVRRFGTMSFNVQATNRLRFNLEFSRVGRDGFTLTTRNLEYPSSSSVWGAFARANPYEVYAPLDETTNRFAGGVSYLWREWNFHYRLGYQTFTQNLTWNNLLSPQRSINVDAPATASELLTSASWSEFRRLRTPVSEFSYDGKVNHRLDIRGGYIYYRYRGPATLDAAFSGTARTNSGGTTFAPYSLSRDSRSEVSEPSHVIDQGFSFKIKEWWNLHADYRYSRFTVDGDSIFHSLLNGTTALTGTSENVWQLGTHQLDLDLEFLPTRALAVRTGIRFMKRDINMFEDGVIDPIRTRRIKTVWPTVSVSYNPSKLFSVRADLQSITSGASYTRVSPHTDVGGRFVFRSQPTPKISIEDNLVVRNRKFQDSNFRNNVRSNALAVSYAFNEHLSGYAGFSYDSILNSDSVTFLRGTPPLSPVWRDQFINRVWRGGIVVKPVQRFGINLSGNFVRTTGLSEISGELPTFGPVTWPLITGAVYYDFPKAGRLSIDLQRTYYIEEIMRGNNFQANLLTIRWTKDF